MVLAKEQRRAAALLFALALDNLGDFLLGHFVFLLFARLCFPFRYVYIRSLWKK